MMLLLHSFNATAHNVLMAGEVVEFHLLVVPMGWNCAVWFVQQMLEHLRPDEAGETTLRHLSPTPLWDFQVVKLFYIDKFAALALSQAEADESPARMLGRLETAGVVARAEPSSDALLVGRPPRISHVSRRPSGSWRMTGVVPLLLRSTAPLGMPCLCLD